MPALKIPIHCQWSLCKNDAESHVRLGFPIFNMKNGPCKLAIALRPNHIDLCAIHIDGTRSRYHNIVLNDIGGCPVHDCADVTSSQRAIRNPST